MSRQRIIAHTLFTEISRNCDVLIPEAGLADRGTCVVDPEGRIQIIEINAGEGGVDAADWAQMVLRMLLRYCQARGWKAEVVDELLR